LALRKEKCAVFRLAYKKSDKKKETEIVP